MRIRYSLKAGLILMACASLWLAHQSYHARLRRAAMEAVAEAGGTVATPDSRIAQTIARLLGPEYVCRIERVDGLFRKLSDEHLAALSRVPELRHIATNHMWGGSSIMSLAIASGGKMNDSPLVTDAAMAHVAKRRNLETLVLFNTAVTDDGVAHLTKLDRLESLMIGSHEITDDSVAHLSQLKSLKRLWTGGTAITPSGVRRLRQALPRCEVIHEGYRSDFL